MPVAIRPFDRSEAGYDRLAAICRRATPWHWHTASAIESYDASLAFNGQAYAAFVAVEGDAIIGFARIWALLRYGARGRRYLHLVVDPDHRRRGVGRRLYTAALASMPGATELLAEVIDAHPPGLEVARAQGFVSAGVEHEQVCQVDRADAARLAQMQTALGGLDVQPLSALKHLPDWRERLHALYMALDGDVPAPVEYTPISLQAYLKAEVDIPAALHEACFIARDGDAWIAISELRKHDDGSRRLYQDLTGVRPAYRRRGVASGLKARCIDWARARGYTEIMTWNDQDNVGMLRANAKVGFERVAQAHLMIKRLPGAGDSAGAATPGQAQSSDPQPEPA